MKKIAAILMAGVIAFAFAACSASGTDDETTTERTTEAVITSVTVSVSDAASESNELTSAESKAGFISKSVNTDDSTVTYTISETDWEEYVDSLKKDITNCYGTLNNDKNIAGMIIATYSSDYTKTTVTVAADEFDTANIETIQSTYLKAMNNYQKWVGNTGATCTVVVEDEDGNTLS
ncbi:MAG: hypothetical protein LUH82_06130 [Clostridiales bacterium]|nr:hypothetical protein [Clostridiales bacterium]